MARDACLDSMSSQVHSVCRRSSVLRCSTRIVEDIGYAVNGQSMNAKTLKNVVCIERI